MRVGRQPRGQVDRNDGNAGGVDVRDHGLEQPGERRVQAGAENRVDDQRAATDLGEVEFPGLAVGNLDDGQAEPSENLEVDAGVAADLGHQTDQEDRSLDATLDQRSRHHEAIAAVVAADAQDGYAAFGEVVVHRFHGGYDLTAGIFHEHERRNADLFNRLPIGFAHLCGIQDAHARRSVT